TQEGGRITTFGVLESVPTQNQHGQLCEIVTGEHIQRAAGEHLAHGREPVTVEPRGVAHSQRPCPVRGRLLTHGTVPPHVRFPVGPRLPARFPARSGHPHRSHGGLCRRGAYAV